MSPEAPITCRIDAALAGRRLDRVLADRLGIGRNEARRLLRQGGVRLHGRPLSAAAKGYRVQAGDELAVDHASLEARPQPNPDMPLTLLEQADGWVGLDKPAHCPVHPLHPAQTHTLLNALLHRFPEIEHVGEGGLRGGVVHRLDVTTSGAMLFALDQPTWTTLREAFRTHQARKVYWAIVSGRPPAEGEQTLPLVVARHRPAFVRRARPDEQDRARISRLSWRTLRQSAKASLLHVELETGFLHQIRATFADLAHPLIGDTSYAAAATHLGRPMLHARRLIIHEPAIDITAPPPDDFQHALEATDLC